MNVLVVNSNSFTLKPDIPLQPCLYCSSQGKTEPWVMAMIDGFLRNSVSMFGNLVSKNS